MFIRCIVTVLIAGMIMIITSCTKFLDIEPPVSKIPKELVFSDDGAASSAAIGIYINLYYNQSFAGGSNSALSTLGGLSADELVNVPRIDRLFLDFQENNIDPLNGNILNLWSSLYTTIYAANSMIEGLASSTGVTPGMKAQLRGEALFIRGFCYFYLTNLFGEVPLVLGTDYKMNSKLARRLVTEVYDQIKADLTEAESLLPDIYTGVERIRPIKYAATALLSRVYLFTGDWGRAEDKATKVIENKNLYDLTNLDNVFVANNIEAIWQLMPPDPVIASEASLFDLSSARNNNALDVNLLAKFEPGDQRVSTWIANVPFGNSTLYLPKKYKRTQVNSPFPKEYSMVLRLAEIYLIRAEAKLRQDKLADAVLDLDKVRTRAGLQRIQQTNPGISKDDLLLSIEKERRCELFTEWGHRWLDLKRWNRATAVLGAIKPGWTASDQLYPIPETELSNNQWLRPQNAGY